MKNSFLLALFITLNVTGAEAQGLMGKHAVLKLDIVNGLQTPAQGLQFEYAVTRNLSFTAGFNFLSSAIRPEYRIQFMGEFLNTANDDLLTRYGYSTSEIYAISTDNVELDYSLSSKVLSSSDVENLSKRSISVASSVFSFGFRSYFNSIFAAPGGSYFSLEYFRGSQVANGSIPLPTLTYDDGSYYGDNFYYVSGTRFKKVEEEFNFSSVQLNFGKQWLISNFLTLDFTYGLAFSTSKAVNRDGLLMGSYLARNNGANFGAIGTPKGDDIYYSSDFRNSTLGLNIYLRLGILLF